eukprot:jgi/Psemu1/31730/gm1.31730_g
MEVAEEENLFDFKDNEDYEEEEDPAAHNNIKTLNNPNGTAVPRCLVYMHGYNIPIGFAHMLCVADIVIEDEEGTVEGKMEVSKVDKEMKEQSKESDCQFVVLLSLVFDAEGLQGGTEGSIKDLPPLLPWVVFVCNIQVVEDFVKLAHVR